MKAKALTSKGTRDFNSVQVFKRDYITNTIKSSFNTSKKVKNSFKETGILEFFNLKKNSKNILLSISSSHKC